MPGQLEKHPEKTFIGRIEKGGFEVRGGSRKEVRGTVTLIGPGVPNPCGIVSFLTAKPPTVVDLTLPN